MFTCKDLNFFHTLKKSIIVDGAFSHLASHVYVSHLDAKPVHEGSSKDLCQCPCLEIYILLLPEALSGEGKENNIAIKIILNNICLSTSACKQELMIYSVLLRKPYLKKGLIFKISMIANIDKKAI